MTLRVATLFAPLALLLWVRPAAAQVAVAADLSATLGGSEHKVGEAVDARFGFRFGLWRKLHFHTVIFQPEVIAGYMHLPALGGPPESEQVGRGGAGMRVGCLCGRVEVLGYGHVSGAGGTRPLDALYDAGAAFDLRFSGSSLGVHFSYNVFGSDGLHWYELGPHFEYRWFAW